MFKWILPLEFIIYSILGWCCECVYCSINQKKWINRGFLSGPYCPIYGFGAVIVIGALKPFMSNPLLIFIFGLLITSVLEYFTSYLLETLFHTKWWDYEGYFMNINGRVCLKNSLMFGGLSVFVMYIVNPYFMHYLELIPLYGRIGLTIVVFGYFFYDIYRTVRVLIADNVEWKEVEILLNEEFENIKYESKAKFQAQIQKLLDKTTLDEQIYAKYLELKEHYEHFQDRSDKIRNHLKHAYPDAKIKRKDLPKILRIIAEEVREKDEEA